MSNSTIVPVAIHGFSVNSALLAALVALATTLLGVLAKLWPQLRQLGNTRRKDDMDVLRDDISTIKLEAREAREAAQRLENIVACMRPAISILMAEVKRLDPNSTSNQAMAQVNDLLSMAAAGDMGIGQGIAALAGIKSRRP